MLNINKKFNSCHIDYINVSFHKSLDRKKGNFQNNLFSYYNENKYNYVFLGRLTRNNEIISTIS